LEWGYHELAFSRRTSGFPVIIYDAEGNELLRFPTEKRAGYVVLPPGAKYVFRQYRTNSGYPNHRLYLIDGEGFKPITEITVSTTPSIIEGLPIPSKLKEALRESL
jgi:hypothetical protein